VPLSIDDKQNARDIESIIKYKRQNVEECRLTLDEKKLSPDEYGFILDGMEFSIEMIRKNRKRVDNNG
jgi:hypothetical protein